MRARDPTEMFHVKRPSSPGLAHLEHQLRELEAAGLLRQRPAVQPGSAVSYCSNDYLGLASGLAEGVAVGSGASRLVAGEHSEHGALEAALARWLRTESALLFTSGYAANVGLVPALAASPDDLVLSDALNHASLVDGCRLARGQTVVFPHLDVQAVRTLLRGRRPKRAWVVTESYFSMDADSPDLVALRRECDEAGATLVVDEAHAVGAFGPEGRGLLAERKVEADVFVGTLGKAFGGGGAFVAGASALTDWLWNRARSFVFSTGLSPVLAAAGLRSLRAIEAGDELRSRLHARATQLREGLSKLGLRPLGYGHIVPWVIGDSTEAVRTADALRAQGFAVQAIRPPSVGEGTARLRLAASARQSEEDIVRLLQAIEALPR